MTESAAEAALIAASLVKGTVTTECSDTVALGDGIRSCPAGSTVTSRGSAVSLVILSGPAVVPDVTGMTESAAEAALIAASLVKGTVTTECSDTVALGDVISSSPAASTVAVCGSAVALAISSGPAVVHDVTAMPESSHTATP